MSVLFRRWGQLMFLYEHLDDICSDMSVFHRVDDITRLPGRTLWKLAWRLGAYQGRMAVVLQELHERMDPAPSSPAASSEMATARPAGLPALEGTADILVAHPAFTASGPFGPVFEVTKIPADSD